MPLPQLKEYSPDRIVLVINGILVYGYGETPVTLEYTEDAIVDEVGAQGDIVLTRSLDERATMTIGLQAASTCNDLFTAMFLAHKAGAGVGGRGPMLLKYDEQIIAQALFTWFRKMPTVEYAREHGVREWPLAIAKLNMFVKGSVR